MQGTQQVCAEDHSCAPSQRHWAGLFVSSVRVSGSLPSRNLGSAPTKTTVEI